MASTCRQPSPSRTPAMILDQILCYLRGVFGATPSGTIPVSGDVNVTNASIAVTGSTKDAGPAWTTVRGVSGLPVNSADMSGGANVTDAPTSGQKLVIDDLLISSDTALNVTFTEETSGTVIRGPIYLAAGVSTQITLRGQTKLPTANKRLVCTASGAGNITIEALYHSEA